MGLKSEATKQKRRPPEGALVKIFALVFYFQGIDYVLRRYLGMPEPLPLAISATAVFLPAYWVPPRPDFSFLRYVVIIGTAVAAFAIALLTPDLLQRYMPIWLAVSLPLFLFSLPLYYFLYKMVRRWRGTKERSR
jgi:hypothetical protein